MLNVFVSKFDYTFFNKFFKNLSRAVSLRKSPSPFCVHLDEWVCCFDWKGKSRWEWERRKKNWNAKNIEIWFAFEIGIQQKLPNVINCNFIIWFMWSNWQSQNSLNTVFKFKNCYHFLTLGYNTFMFGTNSICYQCPKAVYET